jgi:two-component system phosphate regulon sensor histidine kinase PhoR
VEVLWFLFGIAIGVMSLTLYRLRLSQQIKQLTRNLGATPNQALSVTSQLASAIAQQQQYNRDLEQQVEMWKQIVNSAPVGYLQVDEQAQLLWGNPLACRLLNIGQCHNHPPRLLLELVRSYELDALIEQARDAQKPKERDWVFSPTSIDAAQSLRPIPLRGLAVPLRGGQVGVFLEDRQEAMTLAQQRNRWTADVAHELKTPLTSIRLVSETLQMRLEPPLRTWADRLLNETLRLSLLVQELLDLGQLELNPAQRLKLRTIDLPKTIHAAWQGLDPLSSAKQIHLEYDGPASFTLQADEARLHRVFLNLFDNAIKFSHNHQPIRVQVSVQENPTTMYPWIQIDVIDGGDGFPIKALPFVFERFYRADPSRARESAQQDTDLGLTTQLSSGSGLGLAIVQQIIEAHRGKVFAKNHTETGGAWMQILLPWATEHDA